MHKTVEGKKDVETSTSSPIGGIDFILQFKPKMQGS
jgi:hypothetical protein